MKPKTKTIGWGVLGTARIAKKSVIPGILQAPGADLVAIAGRLDSKVQDFVTEFNPKRAYNSYEQLLEDPEVQAVYIPLPNGLHEQWIMKCLQAGKHVLCEKPLCLTEKQAKNCYAEAEKKGLILEEAYAYLHNPLIKRAKEIIKAGEIGKIISLDSHFYFMLENPDDIRWDPALGGGSVYDIGCYPISLIRHLLEEEPGEINSNNQMTPSGVDIHSAGTMLFPGGATGIYHCGFNTAFSMGCNLYGTKGQMEIPLCFNWPYQLHLNIRKEGKLIQEEIFSPDNYMLEIEDFSNSILENRSPLVSPEFSISNAKALDKILG